MRIYYDSWDRAQEKITGEKLPPCVWDIVRAWFWDDKGDVHPDVAPGITLRGAFTWILIYRGLLYVNEPVAYIFLMAPMVVILASGIWAMSKLILLLHRDIRPAKVRQDK